MKTVLLSYFSALRSLARPGVFWHLVWPTLLATFLWTAAMLFSWGALVGWAEGAALDAPLVGGWLQDSGVAMMVLLVLFKISLVVFMLPLIYLTATLIIGAVALPMMLEKVAAQDYPDLARRGGGSNLGSLWNALKVGLGFVAMLFLSLPLWLLPGAGLLISLVLTAWLNQRAFAYDALMVHADAYELKTIPRQHHGKLFTVGLAGAVLAHVPLLNLLAPALTGLAFVHYLLGALRGARQNEHIIEVV